MTIEKPQQNLELKVRLRDWTSAYKTATRIAGPVHESFTQIDTFLVAQTGRLKLRQQSNWTYGELIAYHRPDHLGERLSSFTRTLIGDPASYLTQAEAGDQTRLVVQKHRHVFLWDTVRIHLDEVASLGPFIEFEAQLLPTVTTDDAALALATLRTAFSVADADIIGEAYVDLLARQTGYD